MTPALSLRLPLLVRHCCSTFTGTLAGTVTVCLLLLVRLLCSSLPGTVTVRLLLLIRLLCSSLPGIATSCGFLLVRQQAQPSTSRCRDSETTHSMR